MEPHDDAGHCAGQEGELRKSQNLSPKFCCLSVPLLVMRCAVRSASSAARLRGHLSQRAGVSLNPLCNPTALTVASSLLPLEKPLVMHLRNLFLLTLSASLLRPLPLAHATESAEYPPCHSDPSATEVAAAKSAFQAGQASFHEANYKLAITYWEDAFRRDCTATALLLNLARAYESNQQPDRAALALETYLERRPTTPDRTALEKRIATLQAAAHAHSSSNDRAEPEAPAEPSAHQELSLLPQEEPTQTSSSRPVWPLLLAGGGVVVTAVGAGVWIHSQNTISVCADRDPFGVRVCPDAKTEQEARDAVSWRNIGGTAALVGATAVVTGGLLWFLLDTPQPESAQLVPVVSPGYAGLSFSGSL